MRSRPLARYGPLRRAVTFAAAALAGAALAAAALVPAGGAAPPSALAAPAPLAGAASVALLATRPGAAHTTLHIAPLGGADPGPAVATLAHLPDAVVRARVLPGGSVVVATADTTPGRDASFNASLFRLAPHAPPAWLCDRVVHASRPLVTAAGRVFVSRGVAGPDAAAGARGGSAAMRVDALSIDEVDPATGATRTVHTASGYLAFLAGAWKNALVLYRVYPAGADLVAVDADTGAERVIAPSVPPFARDFSIDTAAGELVLEERDEADPRVWVIDRIDLATGKRSRLVQSAHIALAPHAWPGGGVAYTPDPRVGLTLLGAAPTVRGPLGAGVDAVQAVEPGGGWVAALHTRPGAFDVPFAVRADTGEIRAIPAPPRARVAVAGFVSKGAP